MALQLANYEQKAVEAVKLFWGNRDAAARQQAVAGTVDAGTRGSVTAGKNMDGFAKLVADIVRENGLAHVGIHHEGRSRVTLPGYFRPTKQWDLLVLDGNRLVAAIELKSQVGSFGNNFNNRTEEAIGTAHDLWVAYQDGALGPDQPKPFLGWLMLCEDHEGSRCSLRETSPHFDIYPEFRGASYLKRYDLLCQRLMKEQLYAAASVLASPKSAIADGTFTELSELTSLKAFVAALAGHVAAYAAVYKESAPSRLL